MAQPRSRWRLFTVFLASTSLLAACNNQPKSAELPEGSFFADMDACKALYTEQECQDFELVAQQEYETQAPKYEDTRSCEEKHGPAACQTVRRDDGTSVVMPLMLGFLAGSMMNSGSRTHVIYRDVSRPNYYKPYVPKGRTYTPPPTYRPTRTWTPTARPPQPQPQAPASRPAQTVNRPMTVPNVPPRSATPAPAPAPAPSVAPPATSAPRPVTPTATMPAPAYTAPPTVNVRPAPAAPASPSFRPTPAPAPAPAAPAWRPTPSTRSITSSTFRSTPSRR